MIGIDFVTVDQVAVLVVVEGLVVRIWSFLMKRLLIFLAIDMEVRLS